MTRRPAQVGIERIDYENHHRYKIDGRWALGVTTALKGVPKDEALKRWAARLVADYAVDNLDKIRGMIAEGSDLHTRLFMADLPNQKRDTAAVRGTDVHMIAEQYVTGAEVEVPEHLYPYVEGYAMYVDDWKPESLHQELVVASREHGIAGTLDDISHIPGRGLCLVDYKTSNGIYGEVALQIAAYRHMEICVDDEGNEHPMPQVDDTLCLHIKPHDYELIPVKADREVFGRFLKARDNYVANVQSRKLEKLIGIPLDPPTREAA